MAWEIQRCAIATSEPMRRHYLLATNGREAGNQPQPAGPVFRKPNGLRIVSGPPSVVLDGLRKPILYGRNSSWASGCFPRQ